MSIRETITLQDKMSAVFNKIYGATNKQNQALKKTKDLSKAVDPGQGFQAAPPKIDKARFSVEEFNKAMDDVRAGNKLNGDIGFGSLIALGTTLAASVGILKQGISYTSDLAEVQNVVSVTFGSSESAIDKWSKAALNAYGMNEVSAKRYNGTMGAMLKSSGLADDKIVKMSTDMVGLAGDMASFYNLDIDEAFNKIRSGISGETEPLKQLGVNMSVANLEAYALSEGITKSYESMSQAEQVTLRYNYLLNATKDAQGDFARTSGGFANQTRMLTENWTQFTGVLTEKLMPVLTGCVTLINNVLAFATEHGDGIVAVFSGAAMAVGFLTAAYAIYIIVQKAKILIDTISIAKQAIQTGATIAQAAAAKTATGAQVGLNAALWACPITWIVVAILVAIAAIIGLIVWIVSLVNKVGGLSNAMNVVKLAFVVAWAAIKVAFFTAYDWIATIINKITVTCLRLSVSIGNFMGDIRVKVLTILQDLINGAIGIINNFIGLLNKIPGVNIGLIGEVTFATTAAAENEARKQETADALARYEESIRANQAERDATTANAKMELAKAKTELQTTTAAYIAEAQEKADEATEQPTNVDTVSNVESVGGDVNIAEEDLKMMRDVAEMRVVQNFVTLTPTVAVDAQIHGSVDLDEVADRIEKKLEEEFVKTADGVYA